ncbi:MAG: VOC family protein [Candidatus Rokubacteria bacterium]|nr:VOC family protein [Candidatus Rokubacteria bacterium]
MIRFHHIAIALPRITEAAPLLAGVLGGVPDHGGPSGPYRWGQWRYRDGGRIEILEPMGEDGFLHRFLAARGRGIHHVTFHVPDLHEACRRAEAHGYAIVGRSDSDPRWQEAFLHPKQALGIVVQLTASSDPDADSGMGGWTPPPPPAVLPPAVRVLGLRLRARSAERARTQWHAVIGGSEAGDADGTLLYAWPDSAMRIAVEIDPRAQEGPLAIEVASERALDLPAGAHPALGAAIVQRGAA